MRAWAMKPLMILMTSSTITIKYLFRYNAPAASQVAAIWTHGNDPQKCFDRSVIVYPKGEKMRYIKAYHCFYDPLAYPIFNLRGETG